MSCRLESSRILVNYSPKPYNGLNLANVQLVNHQIVINGSNLDKVTAVTLTDGVAPHALVIESATQSKIIANTTSNVLLLADKLLDLVISSASASSTYTVNFSNCDSELNGAGFNCSITPVANDVLAYDSVTNKWIPKSIAGPWSVLSGNTYLLNGNVGVGLNNPTAVLEVSKSNATDHTLMKAAGVFSTTAADVTGLNLNVTNTPTVASTRSTNGLVVDAKYDSYEDTTGGVTAITGRATVEAFKGGPLSIIGGSFSAMPGSVSGVNSIYGSRSSASMNNGSSTNMYGASGIVGIWGHMATNVYAIAGNNYLSGFTQVDKVYGGYFRTSSTDNFPDVNSTYGVYTLIDANSVSDNSYGVYIDTVKGTVKHSLYAADATAPSYFAGRVGLGIAAPTQKLDVVGDIKTSGCLYYAGGSLGTCASDERIKKDVKPYELGLKELLSINPVNFKYTAPYDQNIGAQTQVGVIAQQLEKVAPQLVKKKQIEETASTVSEIKAVDYGAFTFVIINAVKEFYKTWLNDSIKLHSEISQLKQENLKLKKDNSEMNARLQKLEDLMKAKNSI